jgi:hypothetical protein
LRCSLAKQNGLSLYAPQQALGLAVSEQLAVSVARPINSSRSGTTIMTNNIRNYFYIS